MKIETKLTINNMQKNIKRTIFTSISIILCTVLIFTTMLLISSIKNGINENIEIEYRDYHFIIKKLDIDSFNKIKQKKYIEKIYIQENDDEPLRKVENTYNPTNTNYINVYLKYYNIKETCKYSTDIVNTIGLSSKPLEERQEFIENCKFNQKLLTIYGLIDLEIVEENYISVCVARVNYSYVLDIVIIVILLGLSILFITILYNAFLITVNERKREYAILNSVGATEGQILKMIFLEAITMGIIGIVIGFLISYLCANIILNMLNNVLLDTEYNFKLVFNIKYIVLALFIISINIYMAAIIPSIKASTTSIIQGIKSNKQIKYKRKRNILEKCLPIEGKIALKNIRRNKSKYRIITILIVVCMISYIVISTYINYEKETANLVNEYDVDALLRIEENLDIDYKEILDNYETKFKRKVNYIEYKMMGREALVEPGNALKTNNSVSIHEDNKKSIQITIIGLDNKTYINYINKLKANYGDIIIYNNTTIKDRTEEGISYTFSPAFDIEYNLKLSIIEHYYNNEKDIWEYKITDDKNLNGNMVLTQELIEGYNELKTKFIAPAIFINMETYNKIEEINKKNSSKWIFGNEALTLVKINCENIIEFSNYIKEFNEKQDVEIDASYYSLDNKEKIIYINIIQLILRIIILAIIIIGIVCTVNVINASLCEREEEFRILHSLGATKGNIYKLLIYECIYMFIKAMTISILLSIPILYKIIKYMENIVTLNKLLIPFESICIFFIILFLISLTITIYSIKFIKEKYR